MRRINTVPHTPAYREAPSGSIWRNAWGLIGVLLLIAASLIAASLLTWSVEDPSLSHVTNTRIRNIIGYPGAIVSDLLTQSFGMAAGLIIVPLAVWGLRVMYGAKAGRWRWQITYWFIGGIAVAGALATLPAPDRWPLYTGLGGIVGDFAAMLPRRLMAVMLPGYADFFIGTLFGLGGIYCFVQTCRAMSEPAAVEALPPEETGSTYDEDAELHSDSEDFGDDTDELYEPGAPDRRYASIVLGLVTHWGYSLRARLRRLRLWHQAPARPRREPDLRQFTARLARLDAQAEPEAAWQAPDDEPALAPYEENEGPEPGDDIDEAAMVAGLPEGASRIASGARASHGPSRLVRKAQKARRVKTFKLPALDLLTEPPEGELADGMSDEALEENARALEGVLQDFGVKGEIIAANPGPVVTLYELEPAPGIKSSRVIGLADDIARSMCAISARVAVVPGRNVIGIELPNAARETVYLRTILRSRDFRRAKARLPLCLGKTIAGNSVVSDLARMPHLLIAGTTGSGKSVAINTMILSLLYRLSPQQCRLIMIDPKMLELSVYDGIPHLLTPVVTDPKKAVVALKWTVREMEERYKNMSRLGVRNIEGFNARVKDAQAKGENLVRTVQTGFDAETGEAIYEQQELSFEPMPFIVVIVDEMADLMMVAGKDIEGTIQRLAQMARAAGIHLIMATQRPSVDVITGTIKANFPTRVSFQVTSKIDSRTILGEMGAEQLLGMGDMLYMMGGGRISRLHGPFVSDEEVEQIVAHLKSQGAPEYLEAVTSEDEVEAAQETGGGTVGSSGDELYDKAVNIVLKDRKVSTSYIQRRLSIGYNRAATLIERMEDEGVIGAANHAGKREILVPESEEAFA